MKKVLFIAYYFPPLGMGGTQRALKFVKYLPDFGWQPTVLTVKDILYWARDDKMLDDLENVRVIRTDSFDFQRLYTKLLHPPLHEPHQRTKSSGKGKLEFINKHIIPFFFLPDNKILWKWHVLKTVEKLYKEEKFDAVITTSPPHSAHLIGHKIAKKYNIKWVADFRDAWTDGMYVYDKTLIHKNINHYFENKVCVKSDAIVCTAPSVIDHLSRHVDRKKISFIPNGYDQDDFNISQTNDNKHYTICYSGSVSQASRPDAFFQALVRIRENSPYIYDQIKVNFVGLDISGELDDAIKKYGLSDRVNIIGYRSHQEMMAFLANSDLLLLIALGGDKAKYIPGKAFEYIGSGKPILLIGDVKDTLDILKNYSHCFSFLPFKVDRIAEKIEQLVHNRAEYIEPDPGFQQQFCRKNQTGQLAQILNQVTEIE